MQRTDSWRSFLALATALPGDEATQQERDPGDRYVRFSYGPDQDHTAPILDPQDQPLKVRFVYPGTKAEELDQRLWPYIENLVDSYPGTLWVQCVDPELQFKVVARANFKCSSARLRAAQAEAEAVSVRALKASGVDAMWNAHAEMVTRLLDSLERSHDSVVEIVGAQVTREVEYAELKATIQAAIEWNQEQIRWGSIERMATQLGPTAIQALHGIGAAVAAGKIEDLGERPATGPDRVAFDLRAMDIYARDALGQTTVNPAATLASDNVRAAFMVVLGTAKRAMALAEAAGIDLSAFWAAAIVLLVLLPLPGCEVPLEACRSSATLVDTRPSGAANSWMLCPPDARIEVFPADPAGEQWLVLCSCPTAARPERELLNPLVTPGALR